MKKAQFFLTAIIALLIDQITKHFALSNLPYGGTKEVIGNFFRLTLAKNPGGVFGTRLGGPYFYIFFAFVGVILIFVYFWKTQTRGDRISPYALGLIMAGAIGNLIDRIRFERVTDFLDFGIGRHRWATFNIADSVVLIGLGLLLIVEWKNENSTKGSRGLSTDEAGPLSGAGGGSPVEIKDTEADKRQADTDN